MAIKAGSTLGNIIWFVLCGWWLALGHILWGILFYVFIVTIPFGNRHFEMVGLSLFPYGKQIADG